MAGSAGPRVGVAIVGVGGAVATTAIAGIEMLKAGTNRLDGLPLADVTTEGLADYRDLIFGGWDLCADDLASAARTHRVIGEEELADGASGLAQMKPWKAIGSREFCRNIIGKHMVDAANHREAVDLIADDLASFRKRENLDSVVVINLASTERQPDAGADVLNSIDDFERGLDRNDAEISPAMLYAYAAIQSGTPYGNFTPSVGADVPALIQYAESQNVPIAGKDGKTGQTMMKTVIAPALKSRALHVDGWFSTNILGNRDGQALEDPASLQSKLGTKTNVLDSILGYEVEDHLVDIRYYRPRGDDKEAWDNIDVTGFLGQQMQIKVNFLCKDSILAAPLVVEIARVLDLAKKRGQGGVLEELGLFFKAPMTRGGHQPEHALHAQERMLFDWIGSKY
ncbi:MAG: inositol-3-phosphate synthase [Sphingorhabdus sp.]